jgi:hypothetical protein
MTDALETAGACGLSLQPDRPDEPVMKTPAVGRGGEASFDELIFDWFALTYVLNNLNRGMGLPDAYPFVLPAPAIDKIRFVHDVIHNPRNSKQNRVPDAIEPNQRLSQAQSN